MKLLWNYQKLPELQALPRKDRRRAYKAAVRKSQFWRRWAIWYALGTYLAVTGIALILPLPHSQNAFAREFYVYFLLSLWPGLFCMAAMGIILREARPYMQEEVEKLCRDTEPQA